MLGVGVFAAGALVLGEVVWLLFWAKAGGLTRAAARSPATDSRAELAASNAPQSEAAASRLLKLFPSRGSRFLPRESSLRLRPTQASYLARVTAATARCGSLRGSALWPTP